MANTVLIKRSAVASKVPLTTDLALGELAINTFDGKVYMKKDNGTASIIQVGGGGTSVTTSITAPSTPVAGDLWWDSTVGNLKIYYNDGDTSQWVDASSTLVSSGGGGGTGDMVKLVYDTNDDGIVDAADYATDAGSVGWAGVTDKPLVFTPDAHTQAISTITGLQTALDGKQASGSYEATGTASSLIAAHVALSDPHSQYTTLPAVAAVTGDMIGFIDRTSTTLSFVEATRTFTITPTGATWSVYNLGTLVTVTGARSIVIPNTTGNHIIKINPITQVLESYIGTPQFATDVIVAYIYWNATTSKAVIVGDERHSSKRDTTWHSNQHLNVGTVWRSGGALTHTLDAGGLNLNIATPIVIADEDLTHNITHSASPDGVNYQQILTTDASLEVIYLSGTEYTSTTASNLPWILDTTTISYNLISGGSGSLVDAGDGKFVTYWLIATNDMRSPVKLVLGRQAHASRDAAYAESFEEYDMSFAEQVFMYQIVVTASSTGSRTSGIVTRKITDRLSSASSSYIAGNHGELTGRDTANQHVIGAITGLQTALNAKQATLVSATSIKTVNSTTLLGSGDLVTPNTTYTVSAETVSGGANLRLTDSDAVTDDVKFASGTNATVTRTDANTITIAASVPKTYTFGGTDVPTVGTAKTPYIRVGQISTSVNASLVAKTAPAGGSFVLSILRSANGGVTFPDTVVTLTLTAGSFVTTNATTTALAVGDLLRLDIASVNSAADWTVQLNTLV